MWTVAWIRISLPHTGSAMTGIQYSSRATELGMTDVDSGLDKNILTTYWLSYDRYTAPELLTVARED